MATNYDIMKQRFNRLADVANEPLEYLSIIQGYEEMPIVSLEEAIEPLIDLVSTVQNHAYIAKQRCFNPADGLTPDESASIMLYTMEWFPSNQCLYVVLNATLRSKDRQKLKPWFSYLRLFIGGLTRLPKTTEYPMVYRGIRKDLSAEYQMGRTIVWWAFSSCTKTLNVLQSNLFLGKTGARTMFHIKCKSARNIRNHSYFSDEDEILLLAATQFKVTGCLDQNDLHIIELEESQPEFPLLQPIKYSEPANKSTADSNVLLTSPNHQNTILEEYISRNRNKIKFTFSRENLNDADIEIIAYYIIQNSTSCTQLDLSKNSITMQGARYIAVPLEYNLILKELNLSYNYLGAHGAECIAQALTNNTTLTNLQLSSNQLGLQGVLHLVAALRQNKTLTHLFLEENQINNKAAIYLADLLQNNKTLEELYLDRNLIDDEGVESLNEPLQLNSTLIKLSLCKNKIESKGTQILDEIQKKNTQLKITY